MKTNHPVLLITILAFLLTAFNSGNTTGPEIQITVEINYGAAKDTKTKSIPWEVNLTALEALQRTARVTTYPVSGHVIVTAIDNIKSEKSETAWYYSVNQKRADKLAMKNIINPGDTISWIYKKDVCSKIENNEIAK